MMYLHVRRAGFMALSLLVACGSVVASPMDVKIKQIQAENRNNKIILQSDNNPNVGSNRSNPDRASGWMTVDILVSSAPRRVASQLHKNGLKNIVIAGSLISARIRVSDIDQLQEMDEIKQVREYRGFTRNGAVQSQGVQAMQAGNVSEHFNVRGDGVRVGVMSDSFDCLDGEQADIASGDLPDNVVVVKEIEDCSFGSDEGRALIQIMHDIAPGAEYFFHTGFESGMAGNARAILDLAQKFKVDIIVDDFASYYETFFQDDVTTQAIDRVTKDGVVYVTAAGNAGTNSYEQPFRLTLDPVLKLQAHDFDSGPGLDVYQPVTVPPGEGLSLILQWDQPYHSVSGAPGSMADLDIFLIDAARQEVVASAATNNIGNDPIEILDFQNYSNNEIFHLVISHAAGNIPSLIKYVIPTKFAGSIDGYHTASGTIAGHSNAAGAITVGASLYARTLAYGHPRTDVESFSSVGGTPIIFDNNGVRAAGLAIVRPKPDLTAPNGVNTTFYPGDDLDADGLPNFRGTSAAAPHVAGLVALILEANPDLGPEHVRYILQATAQDILTSDEIFLPQGFDFHSGFGLISGNAAISMARQMDAGVPPDVLEPDHTYPLIDLDAPVQINTDRQNMEGQKLSSGAAYPGLLLLFMCIWMGRTCGCTNSFASLVKARKSS